MSCVSEDLSDSENVPVKKVFRPTDFTVDFAEFNKQKKSIYTKGFNFLATENICNQSTGFGKLETGKPAVESSIDISDIPADNSSSTTSNKPSKKSTNDKVVRSSRRSTRQTKGKARKAIAVDSDSDCDEVVQEIDDSAVILEEEERDRARSPTPPPEFDSAANLKKRRRGVKGINATFKSLAKLKRAVSTDEKPKGRRKRNRKSVDLDTSGDCFIVDPDEGIRESSSFKIRILAPSGIHRFTMLKNEPMQDIFDKMAKIEDVGTGVLSMYVNDRIIEPYDTVTSLDLHIADIIECHIFHCDEDGITKSGDKSLVYDEDDPSLVKLCVQGQNSKDKKITIVMRKEESMLRLMHTYAHKVKKPVEQLTFNFDGEELCKTDTPDSLDMENEDCVDVIIRKS